MYHNQIFIAPNYSLDECKNLFFNLRTSSTIADWEKALEIFSDRMNARFFNAIRILLRQCREHGQQWEQNLSFSIMAINCLLIETLHQFYEGTESTPSLKNKQEFVKFLRKSKNFNFPKNYAELFYRNIRCGILHQAETKGNVALSFTDYGPMVDERPGGWMIFNVNQITEALIQEFDTYVQRLRQPNETNLRQNFIRKMIFIIVKANDAEAISSR